MLESAERTFQAYGRPLDTVTSFKYLGRVLTTADDNCTEVVRNMKKAQKSWEWLNSILGGGEVPTQGSRGYFQGIGTGGDDFRVGDVGADPPHGTGPEKISTPGREADNKETSK